MDPCHGRGGFGRAAPFSSVPLLGEIRDEFLLPEPLQCWPLPSRRNSCTAPSLPLQAQGLLPPADALGFSQVDMHRQAQAPANKPSAAPLENLSLGFVGSRQAKDGFRAPEESCAGPQRKYDYTVKSCFLGSLSQELWCDGQRKANIAFILSF